jgi:hypothetical protein
MTMNSTKRNGTTIKSLPDNEPSWILRDRRRDKRYPIELETRWKLIRGREVLFDGSGRTVDLSSSGILIAADRHLPAGMHLEISIAWPAMLHHVAPLQLVASGKIVRSQGTLVAIRMIQHEFRTVGTASGHRSKRPAELRLVRHRATRVAQERS